MTDAKPDEEPTETPEDEQQLGCFFGGFTVLLLGLIAFSLYRFVPALSFGPPEYESVARVMLVGKTDCLPLYPIESAQARKVEERELVRLDVEVIKSDFLIQRAMELGELEEQASFRMGPSQLLDALTVEQEGDLPIIRIAVRAGRAVDAQAAADAVLKTYLDFVKQRSEKNSDEVKFIITESIVQLDGDLRMLESLSMEIQSRLSKSGHRRERLAEFQKAVLAKETSSQAAAARLASLKSAIEAADSEAEKQFLLQRVLQVSEPPSVAVALKGLKAEVDAMNAELEAISKLRDAEARRCEAAAKDEIRATNVTEEIARKRALHRELVQKLKDTELTGQYSAYKTKVLTAAPFATEVDGF